MQVKFRAVLMATIFLSGLVYTATAAAAPERLYYRYTDAEGNSVMEDRITEGALKYGYTVIGRYGRKIKTVPPRLTDEELAARKAQREKEEAEGNSAEQQEAWDKYLLLRYSSTDDIEAAKQRALNQIQVRIDILEANLQTLKQTIEREQALAADRQRRTGKPPTEDHDALMQSFNAELIGLEKQIAARKTESEQTVVLYDRDIARFSEILSSHGR